MDDLHAALLRKLLAGKFGDSTSVAYGLEGLLRAFCAGRVERCIRARASGNRSYGGRNVRLRVVDEVRALDAE